MANDAPPAGHLDSLILALVARGPLHGYAIIARLRETSDGLFDLPEGTVYPALYRLERAGLVISRERSVEGRRRRLYSLTKAGRTALQEKKRAWTRVARGMQSILGEA